MYFNKKFTEFSYSSGSSSTTLTLSYSVQYLFTENVLWMCAGGEPQVVRWGFCTFWTKRAIQNEDEAEATKIDMILSPDLKWPLIFVVKIKTQLYGYFCGKDKSPAILLTLLVLALLQRKLSTVLSPTKPFDPSFPQLQYFFE